MFGAVSDIHWEVIVVPGKGSGEASPTFGHTNANFSVFTDHIKNQFLQKMNDNDLNMHLHDKIVGLASLLLLRKGPSMIEMSNSAYSIQDSGRSYVLVCF